MFLLTIDPGETTGTAVLDVAKLQSVKLSTHLQEGPYFAPQTLEIMDGLSPANAKIVIERPPVKGDSPRLLHLVGTLKAEAEKAGFSPLLVSPGEWKPYIKRLTKYGGFSKPLRVHEKDAIGLGLYVAVKHFGATYKRGDI